MFIEFLRSTIIEWITTVLDVIAAIASFIFPPLGQAIGLLSGVIDLGAALVSGDPAAIGMAAGGMALGLVPGGRLAGRIIKFAAKGGEALGLARDGVKGATRGLDGGGGRTIGSAARQGRGRQPPTRTEGHLHLDRRTQVRHRPGRRRHRRDGALPD